MVRYIRRLGVVLVLLSGLALAGGADLGFSVRNGSNGNFMGHLGFYLDGFPIDFRSQLVIGAPGGLYLSGEAVYVLPVFLLVRPYLAGGLALGITGYTAQNELRLRLGERFYAVFSVGVQFPDRGYRPYLEVSQIVGSENFQRFTVGFIVEDF
ncbi:hypothetical protein [Meiothermus taiwanensis]|jgi:hypothetical protein|uniref:Outer membrane protein beta-barrel domain-containing protein n=2 Tax=Meiothermus taiwanensis TaxID=172827 RepID=A0A399E2I7_9DEIN|nr:hypothetical protein [Meiothermus taiwanensis]AWR86937.1 hypothetical protein Mtai_v1c17000 [Meiothermus taiwanensis WR-220]KIQ55167.1 hypothetical protein SY28_04650 [Meiothermus taiwanensis]KZK16939.1 hypothetical protein A3962_04200 [Meiothermus taiwanensis]RIH78904.1 hypothetical protein Mcate_00617 [Meiothermus taiwanensis]